LINHLRNEGVVICSTPASDNGGYYLAAAGSEAQMYLRRLERRALKMLWKISRIRKVSLPELLGQMRFHMAEKDEEAEDAA
jgi:16S rRNA G527 N7-methylase RsmG